MNPSASTLTAGKAQSLPDGPLELPGPDHPMHAVWQRLEQVCDPEIPVVNLREMGIVRRVRQQDGTLWVDITPTYSGCPAMRQMAQDIAQALEPEFGAVQVQHHLAPAWSTDWLTTSARDKLRGWGIAPPAAQAPQQVHACGVNSTGAAHAIGASSDAVQPLQFLSRRAEPELVPCPRCGSEQTMAVGQFGSTACKALYRCLSCHEPFDYFKPY
jgi:ring-1,2-phenylacetyl-CoA epoxidase subunit PaaD